MDFNKDITLFLNNGELIPSEDFIFHQGDEGINLMITIKELNGNFMYPYYSLVDLSNIIVSLSFSKPDEYIINTDLEIQDDIIIFPITYDVTNLVGNCYFQLSLTTDNKRLSLPKLKFEVKDTLQ